MPLSDEAKKNKFEYDKKYCKEMLSSYIFHLNIKTESDLLEYYFIYDNIYKIK